MASGDGLQEAVAATERARSVIVLRRHFGYARHEGNCQGGNDPFRNLASHLARVAEKLCAPNTRMGEPSDLAQFIGSEYCKQYFSQKHPVVMFAVMPVLLLLGIWAGLMLLAFIIDSVLGEAAESVGDRFTSQIITYGVIWLPVALTTVIFCRAARNRRVNWRWSMLTAAMLAFFPGMTVSVTAPAVARRCGCSSMWRRSLRSVCRRARQRPVNG